MNEEMKKEIGDMIAAAVGEATKQISETFAKNLESFKSGNGGSGEGSGDELSPGVKEYVDIIKNGDPLAGKPL